MTDLSADEFWRMMGYTRGWKHPLVARLRNRLYRWLQA